jgi:hypothetical protein
MRHPERRRGPKDKYTRKWLEQNRIVERYINWCREGYHDEAIAGCFEVCKDTLYQWFEKFPEMNDARKMGVQLRERWWFEFGRAAAGGKIPGFNSVVYVWMTKNVLKWRNEDRVIEVQQPQIEEKDVKYVTEWGSKLEPSDPKEKDD